MKTTLTLIACAINDIKANKDIMNTKLSFNTVMNQVLNDNLDTHEVDVALDNLIQTISSNFTLHESSKQPADPSIFQVTVTQGLLCFC